MQNLSGQVIKGYELRECLGEGGFGAVYKAHQATVGREVAIKIILPGLASRHDFIRRFETEAQVVAHLEHPCIVPLYDYWRDPDGAYLVMRWLRGGNLSDLLKRGAPEIEIIARMLDQVASALTLAHRNTIIHRDIKPGNILLDEDGNAYLADFGIAKDLKQPDGSGTQMDAIIGSLDYISPEQARSEPVTPRTDIYSLGVVLYEMLTGEHPFPHMTSIERLYKHINDPLPDIVTLDEGIRDAVNEVVQKATAKNPLQRYDDVGQFAAAFKEASGLNRVASGNTVVELLTRREQEVLSLLVAGASNKDVAAKLVITIPTVKWYINEIFRKLRVRSRVQAILRARELNLIVPASSDDETASSVMPSNLPEPKNPYKGLRAFQAADERDFFGREDLVQKLLKRLTPVTALTKTEAESRFLAVVGPSGSGKSSVVKAGLIPALLRGSVPGSDRWFVIEMLPGSRPFDELEIALTRIAPGHIQIHDSLLRDKHGLLRAASLILPQDDSELVIVIDQFEEVFTLVEDETTRANFLDLLRTTVTDKRSRVSIIITLRADFYDRPLNYPEFGDMLRNHMETVLPLSAKGIERAIAEPAKRAGVTFEEGLIATIVSDVNYQAGALPLLQYALTELFEHRTGRNLTHEAYHAIGGAVGALAKRAEAIYLELAPEAQILTRQMFLRLVTLGEGVEDTRRRTDRAELKAMSTDTELLDEIIDTYTGYRLLALDHDPISRAPTVEVAHEALLREWDRLKAWLNESRDDIRLQRQLGTQTDEWQKAGHDESYLLMGTRLTQFETWSGETQLLLTPVERTFLETSLIHRDQEVIKESKRQAREQLIEGRSRTFLRGLVAVLLLATLGAFALTGAAFGERNRAEAALVGERDARATSDANTILAERYAAEAQNLALVNGSQAALGSGDMDRGLVLALEANQIEQPSALDQLTLAQAAYANGTQRRFVAGEAVVDVAFSPDGTMLLSGGDGGSLILWDVATGTQIRQFEGHTDTVICIVFGPDGKTALSASLDSTIILWDIASGKIIRQFTGHTYAVSGVAFSPDGKTFISASEDTTLILWDLATGTRLRDFKGHTDIVQMVRFSPDGKTIISGSSDHLIKVWDIETGEVIRQLEGQTGSVNGLAVSPDGRTLVSAGSETDVYVWDLTTGELLHRMKGHTSFINRVAFSPDGRQALTGSWDSTMILWDVAGGEMIQRFSGHSGVVSGIGFSPDGTKIVSASYDGSLRLWGLTNGQIVRSFNPGDLPAPTWLLGLMISPDGKQALSGSLDATSILWDAQTGQALRHFDGRITDYMPDFHRGLFVTGEGWTSEPASVLVRDLQTGALLQEFKGHETGVVMAVLSPDGETAVSASGWDGSLLVWDLATGEIIRRMTAPDSTPVLVFSPDGSQLLSGGRDGSVILWNINTGEVIHRLQGHTDFMNMAAFSRDGSKLLTASFDKSVILWNTAQGTILHQYTQSAAVYTALFTPDESAFITSSGDNSLIVQDIETGEILRRFTGLPSAIFKVALSPDKHQLLVGFTDGGVELWRMDTQEELLAWTKTNRYIRDLTCDERLLYRLEPLCQPE